MLHVWMSNSEQGFIEPRKLVWGGYIARRIRQNLAGRLYGAACFSPAAKNKERHAINSISVV